MEEGFREISYQDENSRSYAVIEAKDITEFELNMILKNKLDGYIQVDQRKINNKVCMYYDITSKNSIYDVYQKKAIGSTEIINIMKSVSAAIDSAADFLLDMNNIVLLPSLIYEDEKNNLYFMYIPQKTQGICAQMKALMEWILERMDHSDKSVVIEVYDIYHEICDGNCNIGQLCEKINLPQIEEPPKEKETIVAGKEESRTIETIMPETIISDQEVRPSYIDDLFKYGQIACGGAGALIVLNYLAGSKALIRINNTISIIILAVILIIFVLLNCLKDKKEIFAGIKTNNVDIPYKYSFNNSEELEKTQVISVVNKGEEYIQCRLITIDEKQNEGVVIKICELPFIVGSYKNSCNYIINDRRISKMHFKISKRNQQFFITDLNSTNGTYINESRLSRNETEELADGDIIRAALCEYRFEIVK